MKPNKYKCKLYCDEYPCTKVNCDKKLILYADSTNKMEEKSVYDVWRGREIKRAYYEGRVTQTNF